MIVIKFGGSSVANAARIRNVAKIISSYQEPVAVVCSALGGVTDFLISMSDLAAQEIRRISNNSMHFANGIWKSLMNY